MTQPTPIQRLMWNEWGVRRHFLLPCYYAKPVSGFTAPGRPRRWVSGHRDVNTYTQQTPAGLQLVPAHREYVLLPA